MPNWTLLDSKFRLTPWSIQEHADYVLKQYGGLLTKSPQDAQAYVDGYLLAQADFEQAYANQSEFLIRSSQENGGNYQALPDLNLIDWDPARKMAALATATQPVTVVPDPVVANTVDEPAVSPVVQADEAATQAL